MPVSDQSNPPRRSGRLVRLVALLPMLLATIGAAPGCGSYTLEGRAVLGPYSGIELVDPDDPRLRDDGVGGVSIEVVRDPESLGRQTVARATSNGSGAIRLVIDGFGVGFLEETWELRALRGGSEYASDRFKLPFNAGSRRLLVTIRPGDGQGRSSLGAEAERQLGDGDLRIPRDSAIFR